jgi:hypothetical protein
VDRRTLFAVGSFVVSAILTAIGTFSGSDDNQFWQWLVILAVTAVAVAALFWVIVPRFDGGTGGAALVTAIVSVVSLAVFWIGLPVPIAAGAAFLALGAQERPDARRPYVNAALVISAIVVVLAVVLAFAG